MRIGVNESRCSGTHESLFVPEELTEKTLDALGSKRNRQILIELAAHFQKHGSPMTVNELFEKMELQKGAKKGLWRNLETLVRCGLVDRIPEGRKLQKYAYMETRLQSDCDCLLLRGAMTFEVLANTWLSILTANLI